MKTLFLTVLEAEPKIKVPTDLVSGERPLPGLLTTILSLCLHAAKRRGKPSEASS